MLSLNRHEIIGHLGGAPELRYTASKKAVANFSICTNSVWEDEDGERRENAEWHNITVWGARAEFAAKYLRKGAFLRVVGPCRTRKWTDATGVNRWATATHAQEIDFLEPKDDAGNGPAAHAEPAEAAPF